jgi:hypothetical protein
MVLEPGRDAPALPMERRRMACGLHETRVLGVRHRMVEKFELLHAPQAARAGPERAAGDAHEPVRGRSDGRHGSVDGPTHATTAAHATKVIFSPPPPPL